MNAIEISAENYRPFQSLNQAAEILGLDGYGLEPGCKADLILVDYYPPTSFTSDNVWGHFLFGLVDADVDTTIIDGKVVMRNKQILHLEEAKIASASRACAEQVWGRFYR